MRTNNGNIHQKHRTRVRNRYLNESLNSFAPHEIMELLLFYAIPVKDTNELAHELLNRFGGSFVKIFDASVEELMQIKGIGYKTAICIKIISDIARKYNLEKAATFKKSENFTPMSYIKKHLLAYYTNYTVEAVVLLCLDNKMSIISTNEIYKGSVNSAKVQVRKIVEVAVQKNAASLILAHNHPDGLAVPSPDDIDTTKRMYNAFSQIDIELKEHFIVANGKCAGIIDELTKKM